MCCLLIKTITWAAFPCLTRLSCSCFCRQTNGRSPALKLPSSKGKMECWGADPTGRSGSRHGEGCGEFPAVTDCSTSTQGFSFRVRWTTLSPISCCSCRHRFTCLPLTTRCAAVIIAHSVVEAPALALSIKRIISCRFTDCATNSVAAKQLHALSGAQAASLSVAQAAEVRRDLLKEMRLLASLRHPNLLLFLGVTYDVPSDAPRSIITE